MYVDCMTRIQYIKVVLHIVLNMQYSFTSLGASCMYGKYCRKKSERSHTLNGECKGRDKSRRGGGPGWGGACV